LALANCLPDILLASSSDRHVEGPHFVLATLVGDFLFNSTITLGFVIWKGADGVKLE